MRAATRQSPLALTQTRMVGSLLNAAGVVDRVREVGIVTSADEQQEVSVAALGGKGVFCKEVQQAVLNGHADFAVHSAKDLPAVTPAGLCLAAVPTRGDFRDALVGSRLSDLPYGARVATGSVRRRAQLALQRPDLEFFDLRGNIETRLRKAKHFDAIVVALAALQRLELKPSVVEPLSHQLVVPQAAQGALAVECRADDQATVAALKVIEDPFARLAVDVERGFLAALGGGCDTPAGALALPQLALSPSSGEVKVELLAMLACLDNKTFLRHRRSAVLAVDDREGEAETLGREAALFLLNRVGGDSLLAANEALASV